MKKYILVQLLKIDYKVSFYEMEEMTQNMKKKTNMNDTFNRRVCQLHFVKSTLTVIS